MNTEHAAEFDQAMSACMELYGRDVLTDNALRLYWEALIAFSWQLVKAALQEHVRESPYPPKPADLIARLVARDGRPTPDEAWAIALRAQDERQTIVWTDEIATAASTAQPILDAGDEVGARRAFIDHYVRQVQEARRALRPASWCASLGTDPEARAAVITHAVMEGRLNRDFARAVLSPPATTKASQAPALTGLAHPLATVHELPDLDRRNRQRFITIIREATANATAQQHVAQHKAQLARQSANDQARAHQNAEVARLRAK
jgi:hypothetical protein